MDLKKACPNNVDWIKLSHGRFQRCVVINTEMNLRVEQMTGNYLPR
jgi:hypothetical protein